MYLRDGQVLEREDDYEGVHTCPATWEERIDKFKRLTEPLIDEGLRRQIIALVQSLETAEVADLVSLLRCWAYPLTAWGNPLCPRR